MSQLTASGRKRGSRSTTEEKSEAVSVREKVRSKIPSPKPKKSHNRNSIRKSNSINFIAVNKLADEYNTELPLYQHKVANDDQAIGVQQNRKPPTNLRQSRQEKAFALNRILLLRQHPEYLRSISDFDYQKIIGTGGFGEVWLGVDLRTGQQVAIKELKELKLHLRRFILEIHTMILAQGPFVLPLVGYTIEPPYCIITKYMKGQSLYDLIRIKRDKFDPTHRQVIAICIAFAMLHIQKNQILHRDLKAGNILFDENGIPYIADFGVARIHGTPPNRHSLIIGTPNHMAPEVISDPNYTYPVDVFSYGRLMYHLSEFRKPFGRKTLEETLQLVQHGAKPDYSKTSRSMRTFIDKCCAGNPNDRLTFGEIYKKMSTMDVLFPGTKVKTIAEFVKKLNTHESTDKPPEINQEFVDQTQTRLEQEFKLDILNDIPAEFPFYMEILGFEGFPPPSEIMQSGDEDKIKTFLGIVEQEMRPSQFADFYQACSNGIDETIASTLLKLLRRDRQFFDCYIRFKVFSALPPALPSTFELIAELFIKFPERLSLMHQRLIGYILTKRPADGIALFSYYAKAFPSLKNPYPILDLLISYARIFLDKSAGKYFIEIFGYLLSHFIVFKIARIDKLRPVLSAFLKSPILENVKATILVIARVLDQDFKLPWGILTILLKQAPLTLSCLHLFSKCSRYPPSKTLYRKVLRCTAMKKTAVLVLLRFASQSFEHAKVVMTCTAWLSAFPIAYSLRLFLIVFSHQKLRISLVKDSQFPDFLSLLINSPDIQCAPFIISHSPLNQTILESLNDFFHQYFYIVSRSNDDNLIARCIVMMDTVVRVGYVDSFENMVKIVMKALNRPKLKPAATRLLSTMSIHQTLSSRLNNSMLIDYFRKLQSVTGWSQCAVFFLRNIQKIQ